MTIFVIAKDGTKLMPTTNIKKVRKQLKAGLVKIVKHDPFTIQQQYEGEKNTQPIEVKIDTGYAYVGLSVCSEKHEYVSEQRDLRLDEPINHETCRKQHRRPRRNRKRYRAKRFDNRKATKLKGWLPPSIQHKLDLHIQAIARYAKVCPITSIVVEVGQFDTQVLKAVDFGMPVPTGLDYQHGEQYGYDTLREAVFARDDYTCIVCSKSAIKDGRIIRMHHIGYWKNDRSNRTGNLATVCTKCHTHKNHQKNGKLYGLEPDTKSLKAAAFMNTVKYQLVDELKKLYPFVHITFGAITKRTRLTLGLEKSHATDAYCMGKFHPKHRAKTRYYKKRLRNRRSLERFTDAKYIDSRDGSIKKGADLSCGRTNRSEPRMSEKNERIYRKKKVDCGKRTIRRKRYPIQGGDLLLYNGKKFFSKGCHNNGKWVLLSNNKSVSVSKVTVLHHAGGWLEYDPPVKKKK